MELYQIDLVVMICLVGSLAAWFTSMLYSFVMAITRDDNWKFYAYAFCGQVLGTMAAVLGGFFVITR